MNAPTTAYEIIKKHLSTGFWGQGQRMPPLAQLAKQCNVSRATMWKALQALKRDSLLHTRHRGAIIAGQPGIVRTDCDGPNLLWKRVEGRIGQDIFNGAFPDSKLPAVTKLALRYSVSARTIRKALVQLVRNGILTAGGRGFGQAGRHRARVRPTVVLISAGHASGGIALDDPRLRPLVECFERECARLGFSAYMDGFHAESPDGFRRLSATIRSLENVQGFMASFWNPWDDVGRRRWFDLFQFLVDRKVPAIIIDQAGNVEFPNSLLRNRFFRVLRISGEKAGESAAELMMRTGHKRIAYITPYLNVSWARDRYTGLCRYAKRYGGNEVTVELHALGETADQNDLNLAIMDLDKKSIRGLYREQLTDDEIKDLTDRLDRTSWRQIKDKVVAGDDLGTIRKTAEFLIGLADQPHSSPAYALLLERLHHIASNRAVEQYLQPFLTTIFAKSRATAWVCSDDKTATTAVSFLESRGKRVPADISVFGFDNWLAAYEQQLSTFDFNMNGMVLRALQAFADPRSLQNQATISEVEGYVVERKTTRR